MHCWKKFTLYFASNNCQFLTNDFYRAMLAQSWARLCDTKSVCLCVCPSVRDV